MKLPHLKLNTLQDMYGCDFMARKSVREPKTRLRTKVVLHEGQVITYKVGPKVGPSFYR